MTTDPAATATATRKLDVGDFDHIDLLTPERLDALPDGSTIYDIFGGRITKGHTVLDTTTKFGFVPYGVPCDDQHES